MSVTNLTPENFKKEVTNSEIPVLIDFWASWCGPCQMMAPAFENLSDEYANKLKFAKLSTENFPEIAQQFEIQGIPALVLTKEGKEVNRIVGFAPEPVLKQKIDQILDQL